MKGRAYYEFLLQRYMADEATEAEMGELFEELKKGEDDDAWTQMIDSFTGAAERDPLYDPSRWEGLIQTITTKNKKREGGLVRRLGRWSVAAAVILILFAGGLWIILKQQNNNKAISSQVVLEDVKAPEGNRAMITLGDGSRVYLDEAAEGQLASEQGVNLVKLADGQISYEASPNPSGGGEQIRYNTLSNPRGSKVIDMTLSDGSRVWLNAGSSVKYPVAFVEDERKVLITGEAYFKISKSVLVRSSGAATKQSFIVEANGVVTEVLGTEFNVNAYDDESDIRVTLIEGSVRVKSEVRGRKSEVKIKPGEQVIAKTNSPLSIDHSPDIEAVMAWKNGRFLFKDADIETIMKQAARWYDLEVVYEGRISETFNGSISKQVSASKLFKILEATEKVKMEIKGKKVVVKELR